MNQEILNRYLTGDASAEEKQMVVRWLDADPQHMREYLALRKLQDITLGKRNRQQRLIKRNG